MILYFTSYISEVTYYIISLSTARYPLFSLLFLPPSLVLILRLKKINLALYVIDYNGPRFTFQTRESFRYYLAIIINIACFLRPRQMPFRYSRSNPAPVTNSRTQTAPISASPRNVRLHNGSANPCRHARRFLTTVSPNAIVRIAVASAWRNNKPKHHFSKRGSTYF